MIAEGLFDLFFDLIFIAFQGLEVVHLPYQIINALATITAYGTWIIGFDLMSIFISMVVGWWIIKFTVGLIIFIWELIPFT